MNPQELHDFVAPLWKMVPETRPTDPSWTVFDDPNPALLGLHQLPSDPSPLWAFIRASDGRASVCASCHHAEKLIEWHIDRWIEGWRRRHGSGEYLRWVDAPCGHAPNEMSIFEAMMDEEHDRRIATKILLAIWLAYEDAGVVR